MSPSPRLIGAVAVVLVAASVLTVLLSRRTTTDLPDGSPEAVVQSYVTAVLDQDGPRILELLDPELPCTVEDVEVPWLLDEEITVTLQDVEVDGATAVVSVDMAHGSTGLLPDQWTEEQRFELRRTDDGWVVGGDAWPWFECGVNLP